MFRLLRITRYRELAIIRKKTEQNCFFLRFPSLYHEGHSQRVICPNVNPSLDLGPNTITRLSSQIYTFSAIASVAASKTVENNRSLKETTSCKSLFAIAVLGDFSPWCEDLNMALMPYDKPYFAWLTLALKFLKRIRNPRRSGLCQIFPRKVSF